MCEFSQLSLRLLYTVLVPKIIERAKLIIFVSTIKLAVNNEDGSNWERLCDVLVCDRYDKYTIRDKM